MHKLARPSITFYLLYGGVQTQSSRIYSSAAEFFDNLTDTTNEKYPQILLSIVIQLYSCLL